MSQRRVTPDEAAALLADGWTYLDVRSVPEFEEAHPTGACNVPFMHKAASGLTPNPDFEKVVRSAFELDARLLVGCKSGGRSLRACAALAALGYRELIDVRGGFSGEVDAIGQVSCEGWAARALPASTTTEPGKSWAELSRTR